MDAKTLPVLLVLLLGAACGAGLAFALAPADASDPGDGIARTDQAEPGAEGLRTEPPPGSVPDEATLTGGERAVAHLAEVTERNEALRASVTELKEKVATLEPEAATADPKAFRFGVMKASPAFDKANWEELGGHMLELSKVLVDIRDEVLAGGQPSAKSMKGVQTHNTPLGLFALSIAAEMGTNAQVAYTHPAVIANLIRASLAGTGDPLTHGQEIAIATLGDAWQREVEQKTPKANVPALAALVSEVESKLRFLGDVKAVLTSRQRGLLFDPTTEGRVQLDLLSPAWVLVYRRSLPFADRAAMEAGLLTSLFELAEVEVEDSAPYAWVGRPWVDAVPKALEPKAGLSLDVVFPHVDDVLGAARAQVSATASLVGTGRLSEADAKALLGVTWVLHPYVRRATPSVPASDKAGAACCGEEGCKGDCD